MPWHCGAGMLLSRTAPSVRIASMSPVWNAKRMKYLRMKDALFHGVRAIMLTTPTVSISGPVKKRPNALCVRILGSL